MAGVSVVEIGASELLPQITTGSAVSDQKILQNTIKLW